MSHGEKYITFSNLETHFDISAKSKNFSKNPKIQKGKSEPRDMARIFWILLLNTNE